MQNKKIKALLLSLIYLMSTTAALNSLHSTQQEKKVMLITGSTGGIGLETAKIFHKDGWIVYAGFRNTLPDELKAFGESENIHFVPLDMTDPTSMDKAIITILKENGKIDVLVNNAGYGIIGVDEHVSMDDAKELFDVNFFGALELIQKVAPHMKKQKSGHILNISSTSGVRAVPGLGLYAASKFALEAVSESLAATLAPWNIKVSIIEPGTVDNSWGKNCKLSLSPSAEFISNIAAKKLLYKLTYLAKTGQSSIDVAEVILTVANTENPNMRYQTSKKVEDTLSKKLTELNGNTMRDQMIDFFKALINVQRISPNKS